MNTNFEGALRDAVQAEIEKAIEREIPLAQERLAKEIRSKTAQIAATVASRMEFQRFGQELRITVRFETKDQI